MKRHVANAVFVHRGELCSVKEKECGANAVFATLQRGYAAPWKVAPYHFDESMSEVLKLVSHCRDRLYSVLIMRSMICYLGGRHHFFMFIRVVVRFSQTEKILSG